MSHPTTIAAYPDVEKLFDQALASDKGLRLTFETQAQATYNSGRFNNYRKLLRKENRRIYPADDPRHNGTAYDGLQVRLRGNEVHIVKMDISQFNVTELE